MNVPPVLRVRSFQIYWLGIGVSMLGGRAAVAANLWQAQVLSGSIFAVGLVSFFDGIVLLLVGPLGGVIADRVDRRRLVQTAQAVSLLTSATLLALAWSGALRLEHLYAATAVVTAASTFDIPARQALIPALVPRERVIDAFALILPTRQVAFMLGPAVAGILIGFLGVWAVYALDVITYLALIVSFAALRPVQAIARGPSLALWDSLREGFAYVRRRAVLWQLMGLDIAATVLCAYPVVLPALARDVFHVGAPGFGLLASAPGLGELVGAAVIYRLRRVHRQGLLVLAATAAYATATIALALASAYAIAVVLVFTLGFVDAISATVRAAVAQIETPDHLRGRVTSLFFMAVRGGPALGHTQLGAIATLLGPPFALSLGGLGLLAVVAWVAIRPTAVRRYSAVTSEAPA